MGNKIIDIDEVPTELKSTVLAIFGWLSEFSKINAELSNIFDFKITIESVEDRNYVIFEPKGMILNVIYKWMTEELNESEVSYLAEVFENLMIDFDGTCGHDIWSFSGVSNREEFEARVKEADEIQKILDAEEKAEINEE